MSSARKRAAIQKADNEANHLRQRLMLAEHHAATIEEFAFGVAKKADALQARIDALMLEYCPDEMTEAQKANWARHQKPATDDGQVFVLTLANNVCQQLPEGWQLNMCMERGAAWVQLSNPDGNDVILPDAADKSLEQQVNDALCVARGW